MRVIQYNSHHSGVGTDGKLQPERIAHVIAASGADVACLQEIEMMTGYGTFNPGQKWCDVLGPDWHYVFSTLGGTVGGAKGQGNIILSRLPIESPKAKGLVGNRCVLATKINGVTVACIHNDNVSANVRNVEGVQICCWAPIAGVSPAILAGDWNTQATTVEMAPFVQWYTDAWMAASHAGTATAFNTTGATRNSRIDMIFYRGLTLKSCTVPDTRDAAGIYPSDHSPVIADFQ